MKKNLKGFFALMAAALLFGTGAGTLKAEDKGLEAEDMERLDRGRNIFHERCAICHGFDGVPELPEAPNFAEGERLDKSDEELLKTVKHGKDMMPAWKDTLSDKEMHEVLTYARLVMGDVVFQDKCISCHGTNIPAVSEKVPGTKELPSFEGPLDICASCNIEQEMSREEIIGVIKFMRTLSKTK